MTPRPGHLPHNNERIALQKLSSGSELAANDLHPAGLATIAKMVATIVGTTQLYP